MMRKLSLMAAALCLIASEAMADLVTFNPPAAWGYQTRKVTPAERDTPASGGGGAPPNGDVYQFRVTTDGDILSVNQVQIVLQGGVSLYNHPFGDPANAEPGHPGLVALFPSLAADSWITTPGLTQRLGADLPGDGQTAYGDLTDDGPQQDFIFAQLTLPDSGLFRFTARITIASKDNPGEAFVVPYSFAPFLDVPEPSTAILAGAGLVGLAAVAIRKRQRGISA
jgi:hypothetical protein